MHGGGTSGGSGLLKIGVFQSLRGGRDSLRGLVSHFLSSTSQQYQHQQISWPEPVTGQINGSVSSTFPSLCCRLQITHSSRRPPPFWGLLLTYVIFLLTKLQYGSEHNIFYGDTGVFNPPQEQFSSPLYVGVSTQKTWHILYSKAPWYRDQGNYVRKMLNFTIFLHFLTLILIYTHHTKYDNFRPLIYSLYYYKM